MIDHIKITFMSYYLTCPHFGNYKTEKQKKKTKDTYCQDSRRNIEKSNTTAKSISSHYTKKENIIQLLITQLIHNPKN